MAIQVSKAQLVKAHDRVQSLTKKVSSIRKQAEHAVEKVLRTAETGGMAFGFGMLNGKYGRTPELMGMPLDLLLGAALNIGGYIGLAGKHSDHLNNLGDGALASYLTVLGVQVGAKMSEESGKESGKTATVKKGNQLTSEEIAAAVAAAG